MKYVVIKIDPLWDEIIKKFSEEMSFGGVSRIYSNKSERLINQEENDWVGQICEAALFYYFHGNIDGYIEFRKKKNENVYQGDNGRDIPWANVDIKGSLHRNKDKSPYEYTLLVPSEEFKNDWIYILALCDKNHRFVCLVGWAHSDMLKRPGTNRRFPGRYWLEGSKLNDLMPLSVMEGLWS